MVLKDNTYQYLNLTTSNTGEYSLTYSPNIITNTAIIYKNNSYLTASSTTISNTVPSGNALGEVTIPIGSVNTSIVTWVSSGPVLSFTVQNYV